MSRETRGYYPLNLAVSLAIAVGLTQSAARLIYPLIPLAASDATT